MDFILYNPDVLNIIKIYATPKSWLSFCSINKAIRDKYHESHGLFPYQLSHFGTFMDILLRYKTVVDVSVMGSGKTHICLAAIREIHQRTICAGYLPQNVYIYSNKTARSHWESECNTMHTQIFNHSALAKQSGDGCLITKAESKKGKQVLVPSKLLMTLCDIKLSMLKHPECSLTRVKSDRRGCGVIIIVDEAHVIKNVGSDRSKFASALFKFARLHPRSYIILSSATLIDKAQMFSGLLKHTGIINHSRLFTVLHNSTQYLALADMMNFLLRNGTDKEIAAFMHQRDKLMRSAVNGVTGSSTYEKFKIKFFDEYVKRRIVCAMAQAKQAIRPVIENKFCNANSYDDLVMCKELLQKLKGILQFNERTGTIARNIADASAIDNVFESIESVTCKIICRLAEYELEKNPNCRVLCTFNFRSALIYAYQRLEKYKPLVIYGDTSAKKREEACMHFCANLDRRLIIGNTEACSYGISLDDRIGNYPRISFISPDYSMTKMHQVAYRTCRITTKSIPHVYYVYLKSAPYQEMIKLLQTGGILQLNIITSLMNKSKVLRNIISHTTLNEDTNYKFPAEYPSTIEPDVHGRFWVI